MRTSMLLALATALVVSPSRAEQVGVSASTVLEMLARIPAMEGAPDGPAGHYDRSPDADRIARAIASTAPSPEWAARMAVYAAFESAARVSRNGQCIQGDGGKALGPWQLQYVRPEIACDPESAAKHWLWKAQASEVRCRAAGNAPEELLAGVAGGCSFRSARRHARVREMIAKRVLAAVISSPEGAAWILTH